MQLSQAVWPSIGWKLPAVHGWQFSVPSLSAYVPARHFKQSLADLEAGSEKCPASHAIGTVLPLGA